MREIYEEYSLPPMGTFVDPENQKRRWYFRVKKKMGETRDITDVVRHYEIQAKSYSSQIDLKSQNVPTLNKDKPSCVHYIIFLKNIGCIHLWEEQKVRCLCLPLSTVYFKIEFIPKTIQMEDLSFSRTSGKMQENPEGRSLTV